MVKNNKPVSASEGTGTGPATVRVGLSGWLLVAWCAFIAAWVFVDRHGRPMCGFGWLRCGDEGKPGSLWVEPTHGRQILVLGVLGAALLAALWWYERRRDPAGADPVTRTPRKRTIALVGVVGTLVAAHLVLFSPVWDTLPCGETVRINSVVAYPLNCDSPQFLDLAHHPGRILEPDNARQSRPGYVAIGAAATAVIGPVASAIGLDRAYGTDDTAYVPLVLINLLAASAALALFCLVASRLGAPPVITALLGAILAVNDVTKAYYWSPHQQMFTLLVPLVAILLGRWIPRRPTSVRGVALAGLALGAGMLVYGSFVIPIAAAGVLLLFVAWRTGRAEPFARPAGTLPRQRRPTPGGVAEPATPGGAPASSATGDLPAGATEPAAPGDARAAVTVGTAIDMPAGVATDAAESAGYGATEPERPARPLLRLAALLAVFGAAAGGPTVAWMLFCQAVVGSYYNHEMTAYHEFVWLPEAVRAGGAQLRAALSQDIVESSASIIEVAWLPAGLLAVMLVAAVLARVRLAPSHDTEAGADQRALLTATGVTGICILLFLYTIGFWTYRITYNVLPVILVAIAWVAPRLAARSGFARWTVYLGLGAVTAAWVGFQLVSHGPYS